MLRQSYRIRGAGDPCKQVTALMVATGLGHRPGEHPARFPPPSPGCAFLACLPCFNSLVSPHTLYQQKQGNGLIGPKYYFAFLDVELHV